MLRLSLNRLYSASAYLSAAFMIMLALLVLVQIVARNLGVLVETTEISGFCLAAITFLALAYTFKNGEHIRVSLLIRGLNPKQKKWVELWCLSAAFLLSTLLAFHTFEMVYESWSFQEITPGLMAIPVWIPQLGMLVGTTIFSIALLDEFIHVLSGQQPNYDQSEEEEVAEILEELAQTPKSSFELHVSTGVRT